MRERQSWVSSGLSGMRLLLLDLPACTKSDTGAVYHC
jgi:hypothetical protein